jgi:hypothetical protein
MVRTPIQRARTALSLRHGRGAITHAFSQRFWRGLYAFHWILPYPSAEVSTQTTKQGHRMWYSKEPEGIVDDATLELLEPDRWVWARKAWRAGQQPRLPRFVSWSKEEWEMWIEQHADPEYGYSSSWKDWKVNGSDFTGEFY